MTGLRQSMADYKETSLSSDDISDGLSIEWYESGQKSEEREWNVGKLISSSVWQPNGESCPITKIVDGSGVLAGWYENGQKESENHYKDGKPDGPYTGWDENGKKKSEGKEKNALGLGGIATGRRSQSFILAKTAKK